MTWEKGQSGNPDGARRDKWWADALRKEGCREVQDENGKKIKRIERAARQLYDKADKGDVSAMKEIGDRLDGKAAQPIEGTSDDGSLVIKLVRYGNIPPE